MAIDLKSDLSTLTTIPEATISKLNEKIIMCIGNGVEEAILGDKDTVEIDMGYGRLSINISNTQIKYKFIPNKKLEDVVTATVINEKNYFTSAIENSLVQKITEVYKELL